MILIQANFGLFFGRFHALVVHLPIGFLLLGSIFYLLSKREQWQFLQKALPLTFLLSTFGAILSVLMGLLLAKEGGYNEQTLFWHRNLGIATAILSAVFYLNFSGRLKLQGPVTDWGLLASVVLLSITGHFGGQLTHGKHYLLDHAPEFLKATLGGKAIEDQQLTFPMNPDSMFLYEHLIQSIFDQKCVNCHDDNQSRGGLNLATRAGLLKGGDHGDVLKTKPEIGIPLLHRVTLESNDPKFMPPKGLPLNYTEIRLLDYWVNHDHSFEQTITDASIPKDIQQLIQREYGLSSKKRSYVEMAQVPAADPGQIQALIAEGFTIKTLAKTSNFLEVTYRDSIDCAKLEKLEPLKAQITWLNLSRTGLQGNCLAHLQSFPNLTRLQLAQNPIDNDALAFLKEMEHLESLNLYQTSVDGQGLLELRKLDQLQSLYLAETRVDSSAGATLKQVFPMARIVLE